MTVLYLQELSLPPTALPENRTKSSDCMTSHIVNFRKRMWLNSSSVIKTKRYLLIFRPYFSISSIYFEFEWQNTAHDTQQTVDNSGVVKCGWAQTFSGASHISLGLIISKTTVLSLKNLYLVNFLSFYRTKITRNFWSRNI
jgi:hypothetical protein